MTRLVVVGNGMAGIRAIEEVLARGGRELFQITVFGDEPYGNYNRILLSNVLAGVDDPTEIYLNTLAWYDDNGIDLRAGVRVVRIDTFAHLVHADDGTSLRYDKLILATGSRSFGAGQWITASTYAGHSWRDDSADRGEMAAVLSVQRLVHEMLWHLDEVTRRGAADAVTRGRRRSAGRA